METNFYNFQLKNELYHCNTVDHEWTLPSFGLDN